MYRFENKKKALKIYGWTWVATILATLITVAVLKIHTSHHDLAEDPNNLEKIVKVDMPDIAFVESENNLSRSASRWDIYEHKGKFIHELSEDTITALDELCLTDSLHWHKANNRVVYSYYNEGGIDGLYHVFCLISHDGFTINYEVDESEGIFVLFPLIIAYVILLAWGIILFIINLFRRSQKQT
jgi:hypothetical protein